MAGEGMVGKLMARVKDWREERESARLRKRVEEIKIAGTPPVTQQRVSTKEIEEDEEEDEKAIESTARRRPSAGPP